MSAPPRRPLPGVPGALLRPLAWGYGWAVACRNRAFDRGRRRPTSLGLPVISVGNIVAGGSGKTPVTAWLAGRLLERGHRPMIALRGYGAAPGEQSDEAVEHATLLPDVPLAVGPDRVRSVEAVRRSLVSEPRQLGQVGRPDLVLLDDGFQHRQVARDLDLVLVDAGRPCLEGPGSELLPMGWLREPPEALRRAGAVILTHADRVEPGPLRALLATIERLHGGPPVARFVHRWRSLRRFTVGVGGPLRSLPVEEIPLSTLLGLRLVTLLGVAQPDRVREMLVAAGAVPTDDVPVRDHQHYDRRLVARVAERATGADALFTTPKDWVKLAASLEAHPVRSPMRVLVPRLEVEAVEGAEALIGLAEQALRGGG